MFYIFLISAKLFLTFYGRVSSFFAFHCFLGVCVELLCHLTCFQLFDIEFYEEEFRMDYPEGASSLPIFTEKPPSLPEPGHKLYRRSADVSYLAAHIKVPCFDVTLLLRCSTLLYHYYCVLDCMQLKTIVSFVLLIFRIIHPDLIYALVLFGNFSLLSTSRGVYSLGLRLQLETMMMRNRSER